MELYSALFSDTVGILMTFTAVMAMLCIPLTIALVIRSNMNAKK